MKWRGPERRRRRRLINICPCDLSDNRSNQFTLIKDLCVITATTYQLQLWNVTFVFVFFTFTVYCSNICLESSESGKTRKREREQIKVKPSVGGPEPTWACCWSGRSWRMLPGHSRSWSFWWQTPERGSSSLGCSLSGPSCSQTTYLGEECRDEKQESPNTDRLSSDMRLSFALTAQNVHDCLSTHCSIFRSCLSQRGMPDEKLLFLMDSRAPQLPALIMKENKRVKRLHASLSRSLW